MPVYSETNRLLGTSAPEFSLLGADGIQYSLSSFKNTSKAFVIVFMCNHCPYVKAVWDRMNRLADEYKPRGVDFVGINSNDSSKYPEDSFEKMKELVQENRLTFPYLFDETQEVAKAYQAVCTPEFYVYSLQNGKPILKYHGRLDDSWKDETTVTRRDLSLALDQILLGKDPHSDQSAAMGCSIKWKSL